MSEKEIKPYRLRIERYLPEMDEAPRMAEYRVEISGRARLLDALIRIKETEDGSLTFRRSCAHGICGSCAMNVNGRNLLACQSLMRDLPEKITIKPLPALPLIKDLVVDMEPFFGMNERIMPWLVNEEEPPERERIQSPGEAREIGEAITCIMCACCTSACPIYRINGRYFGPSALVKAFRFNMDSRDRAGAERLKAVSDRHGIWRCHGVGHCAEVCPKDIDIPRHIMLLKRRAVRGS